MVVRQAQVFRDKQDINLLTGHCVEEIDPDKQTVAGSTTDGKDFEFPYDKLLIATGSSAIKPEIPGSICREYGYLKAWKTAAK